MLKRTYHLVVIMMLGLLISAFFLPLSKGAACVYAQGEVVYNLNNEAPYAGRTRADVVKHYSDALTAAPGYDRSDSTSYYSRQPYFKAPYDPGRLADDTLLAMQEMTNFFRWLTGGKPLLADCVQSEDLQAGAMVRNYDFNHSVSSSRKPEDMDDALWAKGADARHNILARYYNPQGSIIGWMNEGYSAGSGSWDTLGHRYALISRTISSVQFGYSGNVGIGYVAARNNPNNPGFIAFPSPGYVPNAVVHASVSAWSLDFDTSKVKYVSSAADTARVKITNLNTGESFTRTNADDTAHFYSDSVYFAQPTDAEGRYIDSYEVEISGLTDVATGNSAVIVYTVDFSDMTKDVASFVSSVGADFSSLTIYRDQDDTTSLKKIAAVLPDKVIVTADSGMKCKVPVRGSWKLDEANKYYINSADPVALPANLTDQRNKLSRIMIPYTISDGYYDSFNNLYIDSEDYDYIRDGIPAGSSGTVSVYRTNVSTDTSRVFRVKSNGDGTYTGVKWLDSAEAATGSFTRDGAYDRYSIGSFRESDTGEYLSIYFNSDWGDEAYVSTSIVKLKVFQGSGGGNIDTDAEDSGKAKGKNAAKDSSLTTVTVNNPIVNAAVIDQAIAAAGSNGKYVTEFVIGKNVKKIAKGAFKGTNIKTLIVKSKNLKKNSVKGSLKGSKITTIRVKVGKLKENKKYKKRYKKIFTKKNAGKKAKVK